MNTHHLSATALLAALLATASTDAQDSDAGSASALPAAVQAMVPEAASYAVLYRYDIPTDSALGSAGLPTYALDRSTAFTNGVSVDRVAYYLELWTNNAEAARWVFVSMDAFTRDPHKLGIPAFAAGAQFQQPVTNMTVVAGGSYVTPGTNLATGNIEFWGLNYGPPNAANVPNSSASAYDAGDQPDAGGRYGSMQVHNHAVNGSAATETIFAYNRFGHGGTSDLGIGNNPSGHPDWTFAQNAGSYTARTLLVLARVHPAPQVAFNHHPEHLQVCPLDPATGGALVRIDGSVLSAADTGITVRVLRNGAAHTNLQAALADGWRAPFSFAPTIAADGARYDFDVSVSCSGRADSVLSATGLTVALPRIALTNRPSHLQLYPRAPGTRSATVRIDGALEEPGCTALTLTVLRNGAVHTNIARTLSGSSHAPFAFAVAIGAEQASYDFSLAVTCARHNYPVLSATNVVAGDALLVSGQSNAESRQFNGSANSNRSTWIRSFGTRTTAGATVQADLDWHLADGDAVHAPGAVGQWPLRMARVLVESNGIPLAVINHAEGGQPISFFTRNDRAPEDVNNNYGQMLYRVRRAGLAGAVRAILWYQGESDAGNADVHEKGWLALYQNWKRDFPTVEKVYAVQLHRGCGVDADAALRDRQRLWPDRFSDIEILSTGGLPGHDGCHYAYESGYRLLGEAAARMVLRDLYAATFPSFIDPPNPKHAYFVGAGGSNAELRVRNAEDQLTVTGDPSADFRMEGIAGAKITAVTATGALLQITFDRDVRGGTGLSYFGHTGGQPFITNQLGLGLLSFYNLQIQPAAPRK